MTERYAVLGNPIKHSLSPTIHALFAKETKQDIDYQKELISLDQFQKEVLALKEGGLKGANVTVPFKVDAYELATELSERAKAAGAVNTLKFEGSQIYGDNTDGKGLVTDIVTNLGFDLKGARLLLLGAGGASRGVIHPLFSQGLKKLTIANRSLDKAKDLASLFSSLGDISVSPYAQLKGPFDVIINATSTGLSGEMPPISPTLFKKDALALDMVYSDKLTPFLEIAKEKGAIVRDGIGMLIEQAAESFYVWRGIYPNTAPVFKVLRPSA